MRWLFHIGGKALADSDAVQQHAPLLAVLALDARLLRRAVGVAVEQGVPRAVAPLPGQTYKFD